MEPAENKFVFETEKPTEKNKEKQLKPEWFSIFIKTLFGFSLVAVCFVFWNSHYFQKSNLKALEETNREVQSIPDAVSINLDPFFIRLKKNQGFQVFRIKINLLAQDPEQEIKNSQDSIRDHLIFILSKQTENIFKDSTKRQSLKKEIIEQLNSFLTTGKIKQITMEEHFLS